MTAEQIIELFGMKPLPLEGGYYVETYRCARNIPASQPDQYCRPRSLCTAILYLVTPESFSRLHRLRSDEIFHFYLGDAVTMLLLRPDGSSDVVTLGTDLLRGHRPQLVVPAGTWQGCCLQPGGRFALLGTTMAPGFDPEDFELGGRELLQQYPEHHELIRKLTEGGC